MITAENALRNLLPAFDNDGATIAQIRRVYAEEIADAEAVLNMKPEDIVRRAVDQLVCQAWCALRDLSDYPDVMTADDLDVFGAVTSHAATQKALDKALD